MPQNCHCFLMEVRILIFFSVFFRCKNKPSSLSTLVQLCSANTIINTLRVSSHTHYCIHSNCYTVTLYFYHRATEWKKKQQKKIRKKGTVKWLRTLTFSGTETSEQPQHSLKITLALTALYFTVTNKNSISSFLETLLFEH